MVSNVLVIALLPPTYCSISTLFLPCGRSVRWLPRVFQHATAVYSVWLMALIALERFTFKLMVDRMAPFR